MSTENRYQVSDHRPERHGQLTSRSVAVSLETGLANRRWADVALLTEDRRREGLLLNFNPRENTTIGNLGSGSHGALIDRHDEAHFAQTLIEGLHIKARSLKADHRPPEPRDSTERRRGARGAGRDRGISQDSERRRPRAAGMNASNRNGVRVNMDDRELHNSR